MNSGAVNPRNESGELTLFDRWRVIVAARILIVVVTMTFALIGVVYALMATPIFRADVLMAPAPREETDNALFGSLTSFAALAGIGAQQANTTEALAVLRSRDFTRAFIESRNLMPTLYADEWDSAKAKWKSDDPEEWPDMQAAVRMFDENIRIVRHDKVTNLVTLSIEWTNPQEAAAWANDLVARLNAQMRERAVREASTNIEYLEKELANTNVVTMQQSIGRVIEIQLQKLMLARGDSEFAFRVLDTAEAPKRRVWPMRTLIVMLAGATGFLFSLVLVFLRDAIRRGRGRVTAPTR